MSQRQLRPRRSMRTRQSANESKPASDSRLLVTRHHSTPSDSKHGASRNVDDQRGPVLVAVESLTEKDVLFGRGRHIEAHAGNVSFHEEMRRKLRGYRFLKDSATKNRYTGKIVTRMRTDGTRFLKEKDDRSAFVEVDFSAARVKVAQSLRYLRRIEADDGASSKRQKSQTQVADPSDDIDIEVGSQLDGAGLRDQRVAGKRLTSAAEPPGQESNELDSFDISHHDEMLNFF